MYLAVLDARMYLVYGKGGDLSLNGEAMEIGFLVEHCATSSVLTREYNLGASLGLYESCRLRQLILEQIRTASTYH